MEAEERALAEVNGYLGQAMYSLCVRCPLETYRAHRRGPHSYPERKPRYVQAVSINQVMSALSAPVDEMLRELRRVL